MHGINCATIQNPESLSLSLSTYNEWQFTIIEVLQTRCAPRGLLHQPPFVAIKHLCANICVSKNHKHPAIQSRSNTSPEKQIHSLSKPAQNITHRTLYESSKRAANLQTIRCGI